MMGLWRMRPVILPACLFFLALGAEESSVAAPDLTKLSLEDLLNIEVTSVARKEQTLADSAAAIYVITQEDIEHSGASCLPELLRMAPGLQVARISSDSWAITARGFDGKYADKMLVLVDGRSVYTPTFSGVFWDALDMPLSNIDRIEVIRGPGASVWGANAVNAVINIVTKKTTDTRGAQVSVIAGKEDRRIVTAQYGGRLGATADYRVFGKNFVRSAFDTESGTNAADGWDASRAGFRIDWTPPGANTAMIEGGAYGEHLGQSSNIVRLSPPSQSFVPDQTFVEGRDLLGRWTHVYSATSQLTLQSSLDRYTRSNDNYGERRNTYDLDLQSQFKLSPRQDFVWGADSRGTTDSFDNRQGVAFVPEKRADRLYSGFVEDQVSLMGGLWQLTFGSKFEHNDYSGFEFQPTARALWHVNDRNSVWAAVSRAVKTPSRAEFDLQVNLTAFPTSGGPPGLLALVGDHGFGSVDLLAYETGYRAQPLPSLSFDATAFFNTYTHLRTLESDAPVFRSTPAPPHLLFPLRFANLADGTSFGAEVAAHWRASQRWRLAIWYAYFDLNIHLDPASTDTEHAEGDAPRNQAFLQSVLGLRKSLSLDTEIYYVGRLPAQGVAEHVRTDLRLVWLPTSDLEMSVGMQNILGGNHQEFAFVEDGTQATFIEPAFDVRLTWRH